MREHTICDKVFTLHAVIHHGNILFVPRVDTVQNRQIIFILFRNSDKSLLPVIENFQRHQRLIRFLLDPDLIIPVQLLTI